MSPHARTSSHHRRWLFTWLAYAAVGGLAFWVNESNADEGLTLVGAWRVSLGEVPYRDFFDFVTPGTFYLFGALFELFGPTYLVARAAAISILLSSGWALTRLSRPFLSGWRLAAVPFLWLALFSYYPLINHNPIALCAAVWAWLTWQQAQRRGTAGWYLLAGAAAGVVTWLLQTKGLAVLAAGVVVTVISHRAQVRRLPLALLGFALSLLPLLTFGLPQLAEALIAFPLRYYRDPGGSSVAYLALAGALYLLLGFALVVHRAPRAVYGVWWLGLMLLATSYGLPDAYHLIINWFSALPLTLWLVQPVRWPRAVLEWLRLLTPTLPMAYLAVLVMVPFVLLPRTLGAAAELGWRRWISLQRPDIAAFVKLIRTEVPEAQPIYAGPFLPNVYFEALRPNATPYSHLITGLHPPAFFADAARDLRQRPPHLAVVNYQLVAKYGYDRSNPLDRYLAAAYRELTRRGDLLILVRRPESP